MKSITEKRKKLRNLIRQYFLETSKHNTETGEYYCPLKKRWYPKREMQVAHFIDRNKYCTRYEEDNLLLVSKASNVWDAQKDCEGYKSVHHKDFAEYLGQSTVTRLENLSKGDCRLDSEFINYFINYYRKKLKVHQEKLKLQSEKLAYKIKSQFKNGEFKN